MSDHPLVTLLVTPQNDAATLARCLQSALSQTYENLQVLALDNCSSDESYDILLDFERRYRDRLYTGRTYIKVSPSEHRSRCLAMMNSRTRYLQYLGTDEVLSPTYASRCVDHFLSNEGVGFVSVHADLLEPAGQTREAAPHRASDCVIPGEDEMASFMETGFELQALHMFRTQTFRLSLDETARFNRFPHWLPLVMAASISDHGFIREPLALRGDERSVLGDQFVPDLPELFEHYLFLQAFAEIASRLGKDRIAAALPQALRRLSLSCIRSGRLLKGQENEPGARKYLSLALAFDPDLAGTPVFTSVAGSLSEQPLSWR